jgi:predicted phosphoribosyltransferase
MSGFANLDEGGQRLIPAVRDVVRDLHAPLVLAILPNGVPVAAPLVDALELPLLGVSLDREGEPRVIDMPDVTGRDVVVVDDGVETGTAARLVGAAAREAEVGRLVLAVPVCPRQAESGLRALYDDVVAIDRPLARRDLRWHYADFDTIDEAEARRRLDAR